MPSHSASHETPAPPSSESGRSGFPRKTGSSVSAWLGEAQGDPLLDHRTTPNLPSEADIVIIGSGLSGTLIAHYCLKTWPSKRVVVLEARQFCSGATGRNAGHCKPDQWRGFPRYAKAFGATQAVKILQNEQDTWNALVTYVRENNVNCDLWVGDTFDVPLTEEAAESATAAFNGFKAAGGRTDHIKVTKDPVAASEFTRLKDAKACYAWPASTLNPWKLAAHVMRDNLDKCLHLHTKTEVTNVTPHSGLTGGWNVRTSRGDIKTTQVVYATNAYTSAVQPSLEGLITAIPHICTKVIPPSAPNDPFPLRNSYAVLAGDGLFSVNPRAPRGGSILFGGSNPGQPAFEEWIRQHPEKRTDDSLTTFAPISDAVQKLAESQLHNWKSTMKPGDYQIGWSGILAFTPDDVPFVGQLPGLPGQFICAGHQGHGMARIFTAAPGLVKIIAGGSWADTNLPDVFQITPERLSKLRSQSNIASEKAHL